MQVLCFGDRISAHASVFGVFLGPRLVLLFGLAAAAHRLLSFFFVRLDLSSVSPLCLGPVENLCDSAAHSEFYRRPVSVLVDFSSPVCALCLGLHAAVLAARAEAFISLLDFQVPIAYHRRYFSSRFKFRSCFYFSP
jgi:hypothetical protein